MREIGQKGGAEVFARQELGGGGEDHWSGLLAYLRHPNSTGPLEGLNNKIKVLKRQAYGFREVAYFKLCPFSIHEAAPAFPG